MTDDVSHENGWTGFPHELIAVHEEPVSFETVARRAVEVVPAADHCGITLNRRRGRVGSAAATDPVAEQVDLAQYTLGEGPCLDAAFARDNVIVVNDVLDPRWPAFGDEAKQLGVRSMMAIRLAAKDRTLGALNLYSERPHAFDEDNIDVAVIYGAHAAAALRNAQLISGLETAVESRHLIGMAQGVLMARYQLTPETSFEVLTRYSSNLNVKLRDVAREVVDSGDLPRDAGFAGGSG